MSEDLTIGTKTTPPQGPHEEGLRSRGSAELKISPNALSFHTVLSGPPGPLLRRKYLEGSPTTKGTRLKASGNSGGAGRTYRSKQRLHGGGQVTPEEKERRARQSAAAMKERAESPLWPK